MEQEQQQQQVQVQPAAHLKCPRCASSNTKFCYYNNYSLSQPRYLCKACKRYWTRGGTLRNVPVGGKCRKNKRDKQSSSISISSSASASMVAAVKPSTTVQSSSLQVDVSSPSTTRTHIKNPLCSKRDGKDLSFSQFCMGGDELGFLTSQYLKPAGEDTNVAAISNQVFSGYPLFGISSSTTTSTNSTMSSIIASCLHQQNMEFNGFKESAQTPYGVLGLDGVHDQMVRNNNNGELGNDQLVKDAKMEGNENKFEWKAINGNQNYNEEMKFSSDVPFMWNSSPAQLGLILPTLDLQYPL